MAHWRRLGRIYDPASSHPALVSHAAVPCAEPLSSTTVRVWFAARDAGGRSHAAAIVVDLARPHEVPQPPAAPALSPGPIGCFDDSGVMPTWFAAMPDGRRLLYYIGWNLGVTVPFRNSVGVAQVAADGSLRRLFPGPILDRTATEPHFVASCCVLPDGERFRLWYLACTGWSDASGRPRHHYHIRCAEGPDGIRWDRRGRVAIDYADPSEYAISRPSVVRDGELWRMWFSHRGAAYRIGYAESQDGWNWTRRDASPLGLEPAGTGWESAMVEYPHVFDCAGRRWMLYNGNDYGRSGIGLAVLEGL